MKKEYNTIKATSMPVATQNILTSSSVRMTMNGSQELTEMNARGNANGDDVLLNVD